MPVVDSLNLGTLEKVYMGKSREGLWRMLLLNSCFGGWRYPDDRDWTWTPQSESSLKKSMPNSPSNLLPLLPSAEGWLEEW